MYAKNKKRKALSWIINQMNRALEAKKDNMFRKLPGSITANEPKFIWIEMFNRINGYNKCLALRSLYNEKLHEELSVRINHHILAVNNAMSDINLYDAQNKLNGFGRVRFWNKVNNIIQSFDKGQIKLIPHIKNQQRKRRNTNHKKTFFKMNKLNKRNFDVQSTWNNKETLVENNTDEDIGCIFGDDEDSDY